MDYKEFKEIYAALVPGVYGVVMRVARDERLAQEILTNVFICLYNQGRLTSHTAANPALAFPVLFDCAAEALAAHLSEHDVRESLAAERAQMRAAIHKQGALLEASHV